MDAETRTPRASAGSRAAACSAFHAGNASPGRTQYRVTDSHDHKHLTEGNVVVVVEDPKCNNWLLRLSDLTLHHLTGQSDQYVHLARIESPNAAGSATEAGQ